MKEQKAHTHDFPTAVQTFGICSSVVAIEFVSLMEQLLHEQLLQGASACGLSYSRLAGLWCEEREDCVEERVRLLLESQSVLL